MKKGCILCLLISVISLPLIAQNIIYSNLKELLAQHGDTTAVLRVEKRSRNQIVLTGGADYRITAGDDESMCRRLKKRCFAVRDEKGDLYLNCRKLRYKKLRFGAWYAPAVQLGKNIYFCAMPLGSVIGGNFVEEDDVKLGGNIGDALAASSLVTKRVCYELNGETGKVDFLGKDKMLQLLENYPELKQAYLKDDSQEAKHTFKYLLELRNKQKKINLLFLLSFIFFFSILRRVIRLYCLQFVILNSVYYENNSWQHATSLSGFCRRYPESSRPWLYTYPGADHHSFKKRFALYSLRVARTTGS